MIDLTLKAIPLQSKGLDGAEKKIGNYSKKFIFFPKSGYNYFGGNSFNDRSLRN